jgi:hypothetical protein
MRTPQYRQSCRKPIAVAVPDLADEPAVVRDGTVCQASAVRAAYVCGREALP